MKKPTNRSPKANERARGMAPSYSFQPHHAEDELELELLDAEERAGFRPYLIPDYVCVRPVRVCVADLSRPADSGRIDLPVDISTRSEEEQSSMIKDAIRQHYSKHDGVTALGESIDCYRYFPTFDDFIFYSTSGELLGDSDGSEDRDEPIATLPPRKTNRRR